MNPGSLSPRPAAQHPASVDLNDHFAAVEATLRAYLASETAPLPKQAIDGLRAMISVATRDGYERIEYGARSLLAFLEHPVGAAQQDAEDNRPQISAMLNALVAQLRPWETRTAPYATNAADTALIRKPAQGDRRNQPICLMLSSRAVALNVEAVLIAAGYRVEPICHMHDLDERTPDELPAAILADLAMLQDDPAVREGMNKLRAIRPGAHLFCLSSRNDFDARLDAVRLGATRFLSKPINFSKLVGILDGITARREVRPLRALLVDDDRSLTALYQEALRQAGLTVTSCHQPKEAFDLVASFAPDVIVSDIYMPGCNGLEFAAVLRQDEELVDTTILFLSTETSIYRQLDALDLGADDFLVKPVDLDVFVAAVTARARRARMQKRIRAELKVWQQQLQDALNAASG